MSDCNAQNNGAGIYLEPGSTAVNCRVVANHYDGIIVGANAGVTGNVVTGNTTAGDLSAAGIHLEGSNSRIEDNHLAGNAARGIWDGRQFQQRSKYHHQK
ncbi:MAG: NosD domain-containing protein [Limisphaerales bacterium]